MNTQHFQASALGLTSAAAQAELARVGPNELPKPTRRGIGRIVISVLSEPMFLLLVIAALVYLIIGDPRESVMLAAFALLSVGLVVVQEARSENALEALRALGAPTAMVLRDGTAVRLPAREVVPGDVLGWLYMRAETERTDRTCRREVQRLAGHGERADRRW